MMKFRKILRIAALAAVLCCGIACVKVNERLGQDYLPTDAQYDIRIINLDIDDIEMCAPDGLSAYSLYRFTFGAIRDDVFGLTTRSTAFTLVPVVDTLDYGLPGTQELKRFQFVGVPDTTSVVFDNQRRILQNVHVYPLEKAMDYTKTYPDLSIGTTRISEGIPVYNGYDTLKFNFSREFAERYMHITDDDLDDIDNYQKRFPGIYICTDEPVGNGGRINMFHLPVDVSSGYIYGSYAELSFSAVYDEKTMARRDTSFIFYLGAVDLFDMAGVTSTTVADYPQVAFNLSTHSSSALEGKAGQYIFLEGGLGLKPVIKAESLRDKIVTKIQLNGDDPAKAVIHKANLSLPFEYPEDYAYMAWYPDELSPTCRIVNSSGDITFAGISDTSNSDEIQGELIRTDTYCVYSPDITFHLQGLLKLAADATVSNYDIWMLAMADEVLTSHSSSSSSDYSDYLQQLAYAQYYNSMYNGYGGYGYGGYGYSGYGYGGYGDYYNNYYNYAMMAALYSNSSTETVTTQAMMDLHRYYCGTLNGPASDSALKPSLFVVYSVPKEQ